MIFSSSVGNDAIKSLLSSRRLYFVEGSKIIITTKYVLFYSLNCTDVQCKTKIIYYHIIFILNHALRNYHHHIFSLT